MTNPEIMQRALALAEQGRGSVEPNPMVGAVVVRDRQVVGEGFHRKFGEAHAEVHALREAGERARGATLYVTLEPCSHFGKTPPCADAVIAAGIRKVFVAMLDPFEQVAGRGIAKLREAGIDVEVGLCEAEARFLNRPYLKRLKTGKPYVHAKWAMSLDGKIATRTGDSKWITGESSRALVHQYRGRMDAIVTGRGTLLADDPLMTARPAGLRIPARIVLSSGLRPLPTDRQLLKTVDQAPVMLAVNAENVSRHDAWRKAGAEILGFTSPDDFLKQLAERGMTNVWLEGGAGLLGSFHDTGEIDEVHCFVAPRLIGGSGARSPFGGMGIEKVACGLALQRVETTTMGDDFYIHGWL